MTARLHRLVLATWLLLPFPACATETPAGTDFDSSAGLVVIDVGGDGFVRTGDRRAPLEAIILELRQRTRSMPRDELARFVVRIRLDARNSEGDQARAQSDRDRLIDELGVMNVGQVELR